MGQRNNSEFSRGIEPQTFGFRAPMLYHWVTASLWWASHSLINSSNYPIDIWSFLLFCLLVFVLFFLPDYFILWSVARKQFESRLVNLVDVNIDKLIDGLLIGRSRNMRPMPLVFLWLEMRISRIMRNWLMACVKLPRCCYLHEWLWSPKPTIPSTEFITNEKLVPFWH